MSSKVTCAGVEVDVDEEDDDDGGRVLVVEELLVELLEELLDELELGLPTGTIRAG